MTWEGKDAAGLLAAGMKPSTLTHLFSLLPDYGNYERLSAGELDELKIPRVKPAEVDLKGLTTVLFGSEQYPKRLASISAPPPILFVKGTIPAATGVALIGTRQMTRIGSSVATIGAQAAAELGVPVVSGLALGCDTAAHKAALEAGATTVAVLAHGLDTVHPLENSELALSIVENGGALVSEHPPGVPPTAGRLQARNRIITGLSSVMVPCETPRGSRGTLGAIGYALSERRFLIAPRVKPRYRNNSGAWLGEMAASGRIEPSLYGFSGVAAKTLTEQGFLANGVPETPEELIEMLKVCVWLDRC
jgi:DNA protecting protein DprA